MSRREELLEPDEDLNARKRELFNREYITLPSRRYSIG